MPGERGLRGDLTGFLISNFSHQYHVRILPQDSAERSGEGEPAFGVHRDLIDARELVLNRVLHRDDIQLRAADGTERAAESGGLAPYIATGHQDHPCPT